MLKSTPYMSRTQTTIISHTSTTSSQAHVLPDTSTQHNSIKQLALLVQINRVGYRTSHSLSHTILSEELLLQRNFTFILYPKLTF